MTSSALGPRRGGWRRPVSLPADLAELRGPLTGIVQLPLGVYASGQGNLAGFRQGEGDPGDVLMQRAKTH